MPIADIASGKVSPLDTKVLQEMEEPLRERSCRTGGHECVSLLRSARRSIERHDESIPRCSDLNLYLAVLDTVR